jgi:hypothetical protein
MALQKVLGSTGSDDTLRAMSDEGSLADTPVATSMQNAATVRIVFFMMNCFCL